nr:LysR substrate-binding domain-containing protein [Cupriavidus basilensis]
MTEAGERLMNVVAPHMEAIVEGLTQVAELRDRPSGTIRLTADEFAVQYVLWPALERFLPDYPDIRVELTTDYGLTGIVQARHDAGVRVAAWSPRTWWPYVSARTSACRWWARPRTLRAGRRRKARKT